MKCYAWRYGKVIEFDTEHTRVWELCDEYDCVPFLIVDENGKHVHGDLEKQIRATQECVTRGEYPMPERKFFYNKAGEVIGSQLLKDPHKNARDLLGLRREQLRDLLELKAKLLAASYKY